MSTPVVPAAFTTADLEIIEKQIVFQGYFRLERYRLRHRLFNGGWSKSLTRELFERGEAAGVLLVDPVLNSIVLIEQFRLGPIHKSTQPWLLEIVAGIIDHAESPTETVQRESQEEAGLESHALIPITDYWVSPGASSERVTLFCARVDASQAGGNYGVAEEGEDIRVRVLPISTVYALLESGQLNNAPTLIAVQWFKLNELKVRAQWQTNAK